MRLKYPTGMKFIDIVPDQYSLKNWLKKLLNSGRDSGPDTVLEYLRSKVDDYERELSDWYWIVAGDISSLSLSDIKKFSSHKILLGPNIHFENPEIANVVHSLKNHKLIVPSKWVADYFVNSGIEVRDQIVVWASTVDQNQWSPKNVSRNKVLIYLKDKNRRKLCQDLSNFLSSMGIPIIVLEYGTYTKKDFKRILNKSCWAIWVGGTESQGLALLEAWFMNVPTLVLECNSFTDMNGRTFPASSAPYLSDNCGKFFNLEDEVFSQIEDFNRNYFNHSPRRWALENFSHENVIGNLIKSLSSA